MWKWALTFERTQENVCYRLSNYRLLCIGVFAMQIYAESFPYDIHTHHSVDWVHASWCKITNCLRRIFLHLIFSSGILDGIYIVYSIYCNVHAGAELTRARGHVASMHTTLKTSALVGWPKYSNVWLGYSAWMGDGLGIPSVVGFLGPARYNICIHENVAY